MTEPAKTRVIEAFAVRHPEEVARLMERAASNDVAELLSKWRPEVAAAVASRMVVPAAALAVLALPSPGAARVLEMMRPSHAASLLRTVGDAARKPVIDAMDHAAAAPVRRLLAQPPGTAGAVMDPSVPTIRNDLSASEAVELIRATFPEARSFVYAVSSEGVMEGVASVAELAFAGQTPVDAVMKRGLESIPASASLQTLVSHPGWSKVHQLPVVAADGKLLGVIRHDVVRRIEAELGQVVAQPPAASTAAALGSFYALAVAGMVSWVSQAMFAPGKSEAP